MTETTYTIHERQHKYQTTDPETAEEYSKQGLRVTAITSSH